MNRRLFPTFLLLMALAPAASAALPATAETPPPAPIGDLMAGEFALQLGDLPGAARYYLLAARATDDPEVAERATRIALLARQPGVARLALDRWRALDPDALAMRGAAIQLALRQ